ncbi:hypothetical protein I6E52_06400 [Salinibacterium sp. NG253]|uniref:hypothetical protein n=1 Tax=Salinibacterium sp. NG253 TaxID=2792039 RepID=UPI0018CF3EE5|nr:hypothetical protein [Salinibacterium sp. NG253]MBH0116474.1 hypothetical protein [Salinibacterium sp. NG253]
MGPQPSDPAPAEHIDSATPGAPPIARRGLPGWAWALIIGLPLLLLGAVWVGLVLVGLFFSAASTSAGCDDGYCDWGAPVEPTSTSSDSPLDAADPTNSVPLAGNAVFDGQPVWSLTLEPTWQELDLDLIGLTVFHDDATGCELIASQSVAAPNTENAGDAVLSADLLSQEIKALTAGNSEALVLNAGAATDIPIGGAGSGSTIDFASATISQRNAADVAMSTEIVARSMPDSDVALVAMLTCETATIPTFGEKFDFFSTALAVAVGP